MTQDTNTGSAGSAGSTGLPPDIAAIVQKAVDDALAAQAEKQAALSAPPPPPTARQLVENRGVGKGVQESLYELYDLIKHVLDTVEPVESTKE